MLGPGRAPTGPPSCSRLPAGRLRPDRHRAVPWWRQASIPMPPPGWPAPGAADGPGGAADAARRHRVLRTVSRRLASVLDRWLPSRGRSTGETGSNSWVVAGSRTATGKPILANDPHLATSIPSHLHPDRAALPDRVPDLPVRGRPASAWPGMPGVVIGQNAEIAWGLTTSYVDAQDLYLEEVRGDTVRVGDAYRAAHGAHRGDPGPRRGHAAHDHGPQLARHGPLLSDVDATICARSARSRRRPGNEPYAVALAWTALQPGPHHGRACCRSTRPRTSPSSGPRRRCWSRAVAEPRLRRHGRAPSATSCRVSVPERNRGDGDAVRPAGTPRTTGRAWSRSRSCPYAYEPAGGLHRRGEPARSSGAQYPHHLGSTYSYGWRSQEIIDALSPTPASSARTRASSSSTTTPIRFAADLVPRCSRSRSPTRGSPRASRRWSAGTTRRRHGLGRGGVLQRRRARHPQADLPRRDAGGPVADRRRPLVRRARHAAGRAEQRVVGRRRPPRTWSRRRDDILLAAMTDARKETHLADGAGHRPAGSGAGCTGSRCGNQTLGSSGIAPIERLFNRGDYPVGGGPAVVNAMAFDDTRGLPGDRRADDADAGRPGRSWTTRAGSTRAASPGHAYHPNYDDQAAAVGDQPDRAVSPFSSTPHSGRLTIRTDASESGRSWSARAPR